MKPSTRIASPLALAAVAVALSPAGASALSRPVPAPYISQPITTTEGIATPSIGNGVIAWASLDHPQDSDAPGTTVWTLRDGEPVIAAKLPGVRAYRLEAGTDAAAKPVAIVSGFPTSATRPFYLVRLDTGVAERLRLRSHARPVDDVAIDAGRVLYSTSTARGTTRGISSLWTAKLDGGGLTEQTRLRRSRRGVTFETVRADRRRIAVTGYQPLPAKPDNIDAYLPLYAGTARGVWRRISHGAVSDGGLSEVDAAGFSLSGRSVVATRRARPQGVESFSVERVGLRSGKRSKLRLGNADPTETVEIGESAYDPLTNRLLLSSYLSDPGIYQLGWSSNVFRHPVAGTGDLLATSPPTAPAGGGRRSRPSGASCASSAFRRRAARSCQSASRRRP